MEAQTQANSQTSVDVLATTGAAPLEKKNKIDIGPGGKGKTFICEPHDLAPVAAREIGNLYSKIDAATLTVGVPGGVTVFVKERLQVLEENLKGASGWVLRIKSPYAEMSTGVTRVEAAVTSEAIPNKIMAEMKKECIPIVEWLYQYAFSGRTSDKNDAFLLLSADSLMELGFIAGKRNSTRQMERMHAIDPENIRKYNNAAPRMLNVETLPDVPGSFIYNPLTYKPAGNVIVAVRGGHIRKALSNCTSPAARAMGDLMTKCFEYFLDKSATEHVEKIGLPTFEAIVGMPADRGLKRKCIETQQALDRSRQETRKEKFARLQAETKAFKFEAKALEAEAIACRAIAKSNQAEIKTIKTEMLLEDEETAHKETEAARMLAICDKEELRETFDHHLAVNKSIQTKFNPCGDTHIRVGCMVLKVTNPDHREKSECRRECGQKLPIKKVSDTSEDDSGKIIFLASHLSEQSSGGGPKPTSIKDCLSACSARPTKYVEANTPSLVLLGGHNVCQMRTVLRETMRHFESGSNRRNTLFYTLPGEYPKVIEKLVKISEVSFAVGIADGKLVFVNRAILDSLSDDDNAAVKTVVEKLTGTSVYFFQKNNK